MKMPKICKEFWKIRFSGRKLMVNFCICFFNKCDNSENLNIRIYQGTCINVSNIARQSNVVQSGPMWSKVVQSGPNGPKLSKWSIVFAGSLQEKLTNLLAPSKTEDGLVTRPTYTLNIGALFTKLLGYLSPCIVTFFSG